MSEQLAAAVDAVVQSASQGPVSGEGRVPGVVAGITDRDDTIYLAPQACATSPRALP